MTAADASAADASGDEAGPRPDLRHVDTWLFDLDNCLYPAEAAFMGLVDARITAFTMRATGLPHDAARALQKRYYREHGNTLAGLAAHHGVDPADFLADVHDVPTDSLPPDPALHAAIARLPGRRIVFTNGPARHAERALAALELAPLFAAVFHLEAMLETPKPHPEAFARLIAAHAVTPASTAFFEDTPANLVPAKALGMTTVLVGARTDGLEGGPEAGAFVDHRTAALAPFLLRARLATPAR